MGRGFVAFGGLTARPARAHSGRVPTFANSPDVVLRSGRTVLPYGAGPGDVAVSAPRPSVEVNGEIVAEDLTPAQADAVLAWLRSPVLPADGDLRALVLDLITGDRSIGEIIGWDPPHEWDADGDCVWCYGQAGTRDEQSPCASNPHSPTPDDLLAWLRPRVDEWMIDDHGTDDGQVCVSLQPLGENDKPYRYYGATLAEALERAVRDASETVWWMLRYDEASR